MGKLHVVEQKNFQKYIEDDLQCKDNLYMHVLFDDNNDNCLSQIQLELDNAKVSLLKANSIYH